MNDEKQILIVGSANVDMVVKSERIPERGETVLGGVFSQHQGGKGANQAMAAKTLFDNTAFCAGLGDDNIGREYLSYLKGKGADVSLVKVFKGTHTGVALITVDRDGKNIITVAPGANMLLSPDDMRAIDFGKFSHAAFQLENAVETVFEGLKLAKAAGCVTVLTPAPARPLDDSILKFIDYIIPNEIEILQIRQGCASMEEAANSLIENGVGNVIVTLGERGCALFNKNGKKHYPTYRVTPVDTVGAGDCFTGALLAGFKRFGDIGTAIKFASAAAALKTTKFGAQSYAELGDVLNMMERERP